MEFPRLKALAGKVGSALMSKSYGDGGWLPYGSSIPSSAPWNFWQFERTPKTSMEMETFGPVYACISIISQEVSRMPLKHWVIAEDGSRKIVDNKAPIRIFRKPNRYQTKSDFILYVMRSLLISGNAYCVAKRNDRGEVDQLFPLAPHLVSPYIEPSSKEIFYRVGQDPTSELADLEADDWYPQRDMLHIRLTPRHHPLIGTSPLFAAVNPVDAGQEINKRTAAFFHNGARPSGVLTHPGKLEETAMRRIKDRFMQLTQNSHTGEPAILSEGMSWQALDFTAVDAELIKSYNLSERQVAQIFRIPPFLLGDLEKASFQNVESLTRYFLSSGLGFYVDHIEEALTDFFRLPNNEHISFDVEEAFLRGDLQERMNSYAKGIQSGVFAPNEIRARENLPPVKDGDEPRVQQQLVPLSYGMNIQPPTNNSAPEKEPEEETDKQPELSPEESKAIALHAIKKAMQT